MSTEFERMAEDAGATYRNLDANTVADEVTNYCHQMIDASVDALAVFGGDPTAMVDIAKDCRGGRYSAVPHAALDVDEAGREYATACIGPDQEQALSRSASRSLSTTAQTQAARWSRSPACPS